jgi:hypothetical protein
MELIPILIIFIPILTGILIYILHYDRFNLLIFPAKILIRYLSIKFHLYFNRFTSEVFLNLGN